MIQNTAECSYHTTSLEKREGGREGGREEKFEGGRKARVDVERERRRDRDNILYMSV